ncbi:MAG: hypothetical protein GX492_04930 [Firmicutes bacterium]|nr:hypothetical protein [Bacillota bacterium]
MYTNIPRRLTAGARRRSCLVILAAGVCALIVFARGSVPACLEGDAAAAGPSSYVLQYDVKKGETLSYQVLISETIYSGAKRTTNLYREEIQVESATTGEGRMRQTVTCSGTATPEGGQGRRLEPFRYDLTVEKTGRILEAEGLRPWDGRQVETLWLAQIILPDRPVTPGETWTVNDELYSTASGSLVLERRTYKFEGIEKVGSQDAFKVKYEVSRKGRTNSKDYTYIGTGTFYLASGRLVKLDSSEIVTYAGNGQDTKVITMIQVELAR